MSEVVAALSLGGNVGDVAAAFAFALKRLAETPGVAVTARSSIWRTKAWGKEDQPDFLNMCALVRTSLSARALLNLCLAIEKERGRERGAGRVLPFRDFAGRAGGVAGHDAVGCNIP